MSSSHEPIPKYRSHSRTGDLLEVVGGPCPGQTLRVPKPYDQSIPFPDGSIFDLTHNHPGHKYEWCYVKRKAST